MNCKFIFLLNSFLIIFLSVNGQKQSQLDSTEKKSIAVFEDFMDYIKRDIKGDLNVTSDSSINYVLLHFLFIDRKVDSTLNGEIGEKIFAEGELKRFKRELLNYVRYFQEKPDSTFINNIAIIPLRLSNGTFIYNQMTKFQKANTYVIYDKRNPQKALFYMLFIPPIKAFVNEPRIWSWKLQYQFGKFIFTAPNGEEGYEHIFP